MRRTRTSNLNQYVGTAQRAFESLAGLLKLDAAQPVELALSADGRKKHSALVAELSRPDFDPEEFKSLVDRSQLSDVDREKITTWRAPRKRFHDLRTRMPLTEAGSAEYDRLANSRAEERPSTARRRTSPHPAEDGWAAQTRVEKLVVLLLKSEHSCGIGSPLLQAAMTEAEGRGILPLVAPLLLELASAHEDLLDDAIEQAGAGKSLLSAGIAKRHRAAVLALMPYLGVAEKSPLKTRGANINARMMAAMQADGMTRGMTSRQWAAHLKCAPSMIVKTETWKELDQTRKGLAAEHAKDRRRRSKGSELRQNR